VSDRSAETELHLALITYLLRTGVRPLREGEWPPFATGLLYAEPLSSHEMAAELLVRAGVIKLAEASSMGGWGPFAPLVPVSELQYSVTNTAINDPRLDELLAGFFRMCRHFVGPNVQRALDPIKCHVDDTLVELLRHAGLLERSGSVFTWTAKMIKIMIATGEWSDENLA
jgi:hypothetical protein